jgi:hypothetical protein
MSKQHRTEIIKVLRQQMEEATDPNTKVELAKQLAKLLPKPRQARRPRKTETTPPSNKKGSILDTITGSASDGEKMFNWLVQQVEKLRKEQPSFTPEERKIVLDKLFAGLSARDRAALESRNTEKGV